MEFKKQLLETGYGCPFCGDDCNQEPIDHEKNGHFEGQYFASYECYNCNKKWHECYDMTDVEEIFEEGENESI